MRVKIWTFNYLMQVSFLPLFNMSSLSKQQILKVYKPHPYILFKLDSGTTCMQFKDLHYVIE